MLVLPDSPHEKLTGEQRMAFEAMCALLKNSWEADQKYNGLADTEGGRVISTDLARMLDSRYAKNPSPGKLRDIVPGWDLAWRYSQDRFERELRALNRSQSPSAASKPRSPLRTADVSSARQCAAN